MVSDPKLQKEYLNKSILSRNPFNSFMDSLKNASKYEKNLEQCERILENKKLPSEYKADILIKKGNLLLKLLPTLYSDEDKDNYLEAAHKSYNLAKDLTNNYKKTKDLKRALEKISKKQEAVIKYRFGSTSKMLFLTIASFVLATFFSAMNLTGAVVGATKSDFSILGIFFFIAGLIFALIYARSKR